LVTKYAKSHLWAPDMLSHLWSPDMLKVTKRLKYTPQPNYIFCQCHSEIVALISVWFLNIDELALILNIGGMKTKNTTLFSPNIQNIHRI
jgi:hypothetical protein